MPRAVLDSTILVSAFLTPGGAAYAVLQGGIEDRFTCLLAEEILEETIRRLHAPRLQQRYRYSTADVEIFHVALRASFTLVTGLPSLTGIVRDPSDDMVVACAVAGSATHVVTRDLDLLSLGMYEGIAMVTPETLLTLFRDENKG
jgi:putative PIN family toxin of toxin-antitoxin system